MFEGTLALIRRLTIKRLPRNPPVAVPITRHKMVIQSDSVVVPGLGLWTPGQSPMCRPLVLTHARVPAQNTQSTQHSMTRLPEGVFLW